MKRTSLALALVALVSIEFGCMMSGRSPQQIRLRKIPKQRYLNYRRVPKTTRPR